MPATATPEDVRAEYERRLAAARDAVLDADRRDARLANARLAAFALALAVGAAAAATDSVSWALLVVPAAAFSVLVAWHARVRRAHDLARRRIDLYERRLRNLDGTWPGTGDEGKEFLDPAHAYAEQLDVFGRGSLFELISAARTPQGRRKLAGWLLAPAAPDEVRSRQRAVAEVRPRLDLREDLALLGTAVAAGADLDVLPAWADSAPELAGRAPRVLAFALPAAVVASGCAWFFAGWPAWPTLLGLLAEAALHRREKTRIDGVLRVAEASAHDLELLASLLARLEREGFESPLLADVRAATVVEDDPAAHRIRGLRRRIEFLDAARNQLFAPVAAVLLWRMHLAYSVESWRRRSGRLVRGWIDAVATLEAISSLAGHAYEHPADPFPEIAESGLVFDARGIAHPLLPERRAVRNDLVVDERRRVYVVSGSNMSGKSTLLRTVGANAVLALAGAPVRAESLRISSLAVGASIHVHDSLLDGESRFYAEISRVARIVALARPGGRPLLFLFDELFHGTNSTDRRIGAAAVVRDLVGRGASGLVTTHDLELARLADDLDPYVHNVHFEDRFENGRMVFDYRMRPGVVTHSNALALMRAVGLDVEAAPEKRAGA